MHIGIEFLYSHKQSIGSCERSAHQLWYTSTACVLCAERERTTGRRDTCTGIDIYGATCACGSIATVNVHVSTFILRWTQTRRFTAQKKDVSAISTIRFVGVFAISGGDKDTSAG